MAVTANQLIKIRGGGRRREIKIGNGEHIYQGTLVYRAADGYASATEGNGPFAGIAVAEYDNSSGADGDIVGEVITEGSVELPFNAGNATQAILGDAAYGVDNYNVDDDATGNTKIGNFSKVISASLVEVDIETLQ